MLVYISIKLFVKAFFKKFKNRVFFKFFISPRFKFFHNLFFISLQIQALIDLLEFHGNNFGLILLENTIKRLNLSKTICIFVLLNYTSDPLVWRQTRTANI